MRRISFRSGDDASDAKMGELTSRPIIKADGSSPSRTIDTLKSCTTPSALIPLDEMAPRSRYMRMFRSENIPSRLKESRGDVSAIWLLVIASCQYIVNISSLLENRLDALSRRQSYVCEFLTRFV